MRSFRLPHFIPALFALGAFTPHAPSQEKPLDKPANPAADSIPAIEPLAVGNYWTMKETTFATDGEIDSESFSTVVVVKKEDIGGRTCFRMNQIYHDTARFDPKLAASDQEAGATYWEFLENGNLYYFDTADAPPPASPDPEKPDADTTEDPAPAPVPDPAAPARLFTSDEPALYLKFPAAAGDLYQSFDTVGSVIATDRTVQTPAGEFVCHVYGFITDAAETLPHRSYTLEHWCPGIGFVKLLEYEIVGDQSRLTYSMELLAYHLEDGRSGGDTGDDPRRSKIENVH